MPDDTKRARPRSGRRCRPGSRRDHVPGCPGHRVRDSRTEDIRRWGYTEAMNGHLLAEALKLSPGDRLRMIEALWETPSDEDIPVTPEERALLDARLADLEANPGDQSPWSEVRARLEQRPR